MSRIGKLPIDIPKGVKVQLAKRNVSITGPKGTLSLKYKGEITVEQEGEKLLVKRQGEDRQNRAFQGLYQRLLTNMVVGVTQGYKKSLVISGVGYRAELKGKELVVQAGLSHHPHYPIPDGITIKVPKPDYVEIEGIDKQLVGQVAADIRKIRPPEPYKGKGIRYSDERIRRKVGKTGAK